MGAESWLRPEVLSAVSVLLGALLGILGTLAVTWVSKRFEDRRHLRELAITAALENYKFKREDVEGGLMPPLDDYIIHMLCVAEVISKRKLKPENLSQVLGAIRSISSSFEKFYIDEGTMRPGSGQRRSTSVVGKD